MQCLVSSNSIQTLHLSHHNLISVKIVPPIMTVNKSATPCQFPSAIVVDCWPMLLQWHTPKQLQYNPSWNKQRQYLSNDSPTPSTNKNSIGHSNTINYHLKDTNCTPSPAQHASKPLYIAKSFKDWLQAPTHSIITPQIRRLLLHEFWWHVDHILVAVEEPNLPQSILLHSSYKSSITHQCTSSFHCYRRTSLRGRKFVTTKLIVNGWCYEQRICCFEDAIRCLRWWRKGVRSQNGVAIVGRTCNRLQTDDDNQPPIKKLK